MAEPMRCFRARGAALTVSGVALLLGSTVLASSAAAQVASATPPPLPSAPAAAASATPPTSPTAGQVLPRQTGVVGRILIQGNERIDPETILSYLPISPGESVDAPKIDAALKALFRTDLFSDVKIDLQGTDLVVHVIEKPDHQPGAVRGKLQPQAGQVCRTRFRSARAACSPRPRSKKTLVGSSNSTVAPGASRRR